MPNESAPDLIEESRLDLIEESRLAGKEIVGALGLDPNNVRGFTLSFQVGSIPQLTVDYVRTPVDATSIATSLGFFELVKRKE